MKDFILFAILGLGTGAAYAILGLGIVLIQKGSGILNFAHGATAMMAAYVFANNVGAGTAKPVSLALVLAVSAAGGVFFYFGVMRPLRKAPVLAGLVATLGMMVALQGLAIKIYGTDQLPAPSIFPTDSVKLFGVAFGQDRLWLLGVTIALAAGLWAVYRFTVFGLATRAAAESERGASYLGFSPDSIAATNWALGCMLAAFAGICIAPLSSLNVLTLSLLVLPALAAALIGRFSSFGLTAVAGIVIGVAQSLLTKYWTQPGVTDALPFVVVILAMIITGKLIPGRGTIAVARPPLSPPGRLSPIPTGMVAALVVVGILGLGTTYQSALTVSLIVAIAALSVVVVTGLVGQMSLMPMTFAGIGALLVSKFATDWGVPFPWPILMAAAAATPIGVLLGVPALRVRGLNLAVVTIGAAVAINAMLFNNSDYTGGPSGSQVPSPSIFGFSLDSVTHPERFGFLSLAVLVIVTALVLNLRRSAFGRRMLAVRGNERAAAAAGVNVAATKLQAFALSAAIASLSGGMLAYQLGAVSFERFDAFSSITLVTVVYIAGIAAVSGGLLAGAIASGGILYVFMDDKLSMGDYYAIISGLGLLLTVVTQPDGIVVVWREQAAWFRKKLSRRADATGEAHAGRAAAVPVGTIAPSSERTPTGVS
jgi:branched-chain amino acid transport system permease protein